MKVMGSVSCCALIRKRVRYICHVVVFTFITLGGGRSNLLVESSESPHPSREGFGCFAVAGDANLLSICTRGQFQNYGATRKKMQRISSILGGQGALVKCRTGHGILASDGE